MQEVFEKIIEKLEEQKVKGIYDSSSIIGEKNVWAEAIDIVKQEAEKYKGGWIPVSEKLPEESLNSVIGWDEYRERCCFVQYYGGRWILGNDIDSVKIIAWKPLPKPFQKGDNNENS